MLVPIPTHEQFGMTRKERPGRDVEAFISWRFVLVALGILGIVGVAIAAFGWLAG